MRSRYKLALGLSLMMTTAFAGIASAQEKTLRIAMTAADIPRTLGQPDQGFEGNRFTGIPIYDALVHWDLSKEKEPSVPIPGLATDWSVDQAMAFILSAGAASPDQLPFALGRKPT